MDRVSLQSKYNANLDFERDASLAVGMTAKQVMRYFQSLTDSVARSKRPDLAATPECCGPSRCAAAEPNFKYGQGSIVKVKQTNWATVHA